MPDRDRDKKSAHRGSGSEGQSAHGRHGKDRPRDSQGHFTGGSSSSEDSTSGRSKRQGSEESDPESEDEG